MGVDNTVVNGVLVGISWVIFKNSIFPDTCGMFSLTIYHS